MDTPQAAPIPKARIRIIGTSHIAKQSAKEIERIFDEFQPDIVAVELDPGRLHGLKEKAAGKKEAPLSLSMIRQVGVTGFIFAAIGKAAQKRMGDIMNVNPGLDMLAAVQLAERNGRLLALVDQEIAVTMRLLSDQFTFREKMRVLGDILAAPFRKQKYKFDLSKVPDEQALEALIGQLRARYPSLYNVLIVERNIIMARNLDMIVRRNPGKRILLVIGAGHGDDLRKRLRQLEHLAEIE
jgi:pheromone shutdown protein TraB